MECMEEKYQIVHGDTDTDTCESGRHIINDIACGQPVPGPQVKNINCGNCYFHRNVLQHPVSERPESGVTLLFRSERERGTE